MGFIFFEMIRMIKINVVMENVRIRNRISLLRYEFFFIGGIDFVVDIFEVDELFEYFVICFLWYGIEWVDL